ncbi:MAG TPA: lysylphosphatidylglycerol synthase domain-containing protein [Rhodocyclaceae bacterium]|nr:lysylphosphatidylglycerol synthase domain-containing protein [Rhodocyclaceae bacterium]
MRATEHGAAARLGHKSPLKQRTWWPHAKRGLTLAFFALIAWLLIDQARSIEWMEVGKATTRLPPAAIGMAAVLAALSFVVYTTFDLIGRAYTKHTLQTHCVMLVAFISYAFNLNIGSLVGGIAFRYRLYTEFGLGNDVITRVLSLSMLTNWLGYFALGGIVLCFFTPELPARWQAQWQTAALLLPWLGSALLAVAGAYVLACAFAKRRRWRWRSHTLVLPTARMALLQLALAMLNWMIIAGIVFAVLQARIDYPTILAVLLIASVAGLIVHVPAGLGVIEAVFVAMLSSRLPATEVLAGLLAYRAVYYLLPLALATVLFTRVEWRARFSGH